MNLRYFFYWVPEEEFDEIRKQLKNQRIRLMPISGVPCKAIHPTAEFAFVPPKTWDQVCRRQGSWYRNSTLSGKVLVTSVKPLQTLKKHLSGVIEPVDFQPPKAISAGDVQRMSGKLLDSGREPEEWRKIGPRETRYWKNLLSRIRGSGNLTSQIPLHSANHENFIEPEYYVMEDGKKIPYSPAKTEGLCSACVELFNILGGEFEKKYVTPCPGLSLYAEYPANRYLQVISGSGALEIFEKHSLLSR